MSALLKYINENPLDWKNKIRIDFKIHVKEERGYVLLIYDSKADFNNPIVQECRGIILDDENQIVCCPFYKFGNFNEKYVPDIDWNSARVEEKLDGSIVKFWYDKGKWNTSSNTQIDFKLSFDVNTSQFDIEYTYIFELIGKSNRLKVPYIKDELVHIGVRNNKTLEELNVKLDGFRHPRIFDLHSLEQCEEYLKTSEEFIEGFVIVDKNWNRLKIKSPRYLTTTIPSKKTLILKLLKDEQLDDFPEHYFDDERQKIKALIEDLPNHKAFKYRREPLNETEWLIKNIAYTLKFI